MELNQTNSLVLAYLGDSVFETYFRELFIKEGMNNVNDLQKRVTKIVCAGTQSKIYEQLIIQELVNNYELDVMKRGRNAKSKSKAKNASIGEYHNATGLEMLIGYLYLKDSERLKKILESIKEIVLC